MRKMTDDAVDNQQPNQVDSLAFKARRISKNTQKI